MVEFFETVTQIHFWVVSPLGWLALELYCWLFERNVPVKPEWGE